MTSLNGHSEDDTLAEGAYRGVCVCVDYPQICLVSGILSDVCVFVSEIFVLFLHWWQKVSLLTLGLIQCLRGSATYPEGIHVSTHTHTHTYCSFVRDSFRIVSLNLL